MHTRTHAHALPGEAETVSSQAPRQCRLLPNAPASRFYTPHRSRTSSVADEQSLHTGGAHLWLVISSADGEAR